MFSSHALAFFLAACSPCPITANKKFCIRIEAHSRRKSNGVRSPLNPTDSLASPWSAGSWGDVALRLALGAFSLQPPLTERAGTDMPTPAGPRYGSDAGMRGQPRRPKMPRRRRLLQEFGKPRGKNGLLQYACRVHGFANRVPGRVAGRHDWQANLFAASAQQREPVFCSRQSRLQEDRKCEAA